MKSNKEAVIDIFASVLWACGGELGDLEREAARTISEDFGFGAGLIFEKALEAALNGMDKLDMNGVNDRVAAASKKVVPSERDMVFEGVLELVLADSVVARGEVEVLLEIATSLEIADARAVMMLADMTNAEAVNKTNEAAIADRLAKAGNKVDEALAICNEIADTETFKVEI